MSSEAWEEVREVLRLSARELQLVQHIFDGKKLSAIAEDMHLSLGTVKTYSQRVHSKLDVTDQRELTLVIIDVHLQQQRRLLRLQGAQQIPAPTTTGELR